VAPAHARGGDGALQGSGTGRRVLAPRVRRRRQPRTATRGS
jgi:hypothetical protein